MRARWMLGLLGWLAIAAGAHAYTNPCPTGCNTGLSETTLTSGLKSMPDCMCDWNEHAYGPNTTLLNDFLINGLQVCVVLDGVVSTDDAWEIWTAPRATTLHSTSCHCSANCGGTLPTIAWKDRSANAIALTGGGDLSCVSGTGDSSYTTFDTGDSDRLLGVGEGVQFDVTNVPTGSPRILLCLHFRE